MFGTWVVDAAERAVKSFAQTLLVIWGSGQLDVFHLDLWSAVGVAGGAAVVSVLTSIASMPFGSAGTAGLTYATHATDTVPAG